MMEEAGLGSVRLVSAPLGNTLHFVAGGRLERRPPNLDSPP
jgi:hypothetical protein